MPIPDLAINDARPETSDAVLVILPEFEQTPEPAESFAGLAEPLRAIAFTGSFNVFSRVYAPEYASGAVGVVGIGKNASDDQIRTAVGAAVRLFTGIDSLAIDATAVPDAWLAVLQGAAFGAYTFEPQTSESDDERAKRRRASVITVVTPTVPESATDGAARVALEAEALALVKDLVSMTGADLTPEVFAERAQSDTSSLPIETTVWDVDALEKDAFGGILGVGQGALNGPRLVRIDYAPEGATRHIALVGKGITYDTGGLSLKPANSMVGMQEDMAGAAAVLAVVRALAQMQATVHVTGWLCLAENALSAASQRPSDILTIADGTTVEVTNTDAEGRLVLADGLVAASREQPDVIIDVATLTGGILIALGTRTTAVMGDDAEIAKYLRASEATGDPAWQLPLPAYIAEELKSRVADIRNANVGNRNGGSLFAGLFLQRFVGKTGDADDSPRIPWFHLDIAGSGMSTSTAFGFTDKGPTGATVRALIEYALESEPLDD